MDVSNCIQESSMGRSGINFMFGPSRFKNAYRRHIFSIHLTRFREDDLMDN